jgi:Uma2 family endonuclease
MVVIAVPGNDRYFTPEEYFIWEEQQLEKHELIDGHVYAMSGGTQNHSAIAINFLLLIRLHLRGKSCNVFNSDLKINILNTPNYTYPDLSVTCQQFQIQKWMTLKALPSKLFTILNN